MPDAVVPVVCVALNAVDVMLPPRAVLNAIPQLLFAMATCIYPYAPAALDFFLPPRKRLRKPMEHEQTGALDIFLMPLGPEGERMRSEAVFN
jgi:hypothetical protein